MKKNLIPEELKNQPYWITWKWKDGKKAPCSPNGYTSNANDPNNHLTYEQASDILSKNQRLAGLGFVLHETNEYMGVDLDECLDDNKKMKPQIEEILEGYKGMLEISPSGNGLKLIVRGKKPEGVGYTISGERFGIKALEWYDRGQYFTITGDSYNGIDEIIDGTEISEKLAPYFASQSAPTPTFSKPSISSDFDHSREDQAYCYKLANQDPYDYQKVDEEFRKSDLMRPKWDVIHSSDGRTYGQMTNEKAHEIVKLKKYIDKRRFLENTYEFRRNLVTSRIEYRHRGIGEFIQLTDSHQNAILESIRLRSGRITITSLMEMINTPAMAPDYDPIKKYLLALPDWDGHDYLDKLCACLDTSDAALTKLMIKRWMVGMMSQLLKHKVNQGCLVLKGGQGMGKTSFVYRLVPEELREYYYSGTIREESKDTLMLMVGKMIINMDELANLQRRESSQLKELITKDEISYRMPYERTIQQCIRRASFIGSVNNASFLGDDTGSRRFWVIECRAINWQSMPDIKKVYAQVIHLMNTGERGWMDQKEQKLIEDHNNQFSLPSVELDLLNTYAKKAVNPGDRLTITQIRAKLCDVSEIPVSQINQNKLRQALENLEFERVRSDGAYRYKISICGETKLERQLSNIFN